jgi:hypothetical protein
MWGRGAAAALLAAVLCVPGAEGREARLAIGFQYFDARDFHEGLAAVRSNDLWGYIDVTDRVVVPFTYKVPEVGEFSEGFAFVGGHFIDTEGKPAFEGKTFEQASRFSEGLSAVQTGGQWGFIGLDGNFAIPPSYEGAGDFSGGMAPVRKNGLWGYIDVQGRMLIGPRFLRADVFSASDEGLAAVDFQGMVGYIDRSGRFAISPLFQEAGRFRNALAPVRRPPEPDFPSAGDWGYIDLSGREAIPRGFYGAGEFENGLAPVSTRARWGYVDVRGQLVLDALYDGARSFSEGLAAVERDGKWGYIRER